jgi:DGQHR domain-containing protein
MKKKKVMKLINKVINSLAINLVQDGIEILLTKMKVTDLIECTEADIYDSNENEDGYQRPINLTQVTKIYEYLMMEQHSILPTSIILAIKKEYVTVLKENGGIKFKDMLRIVDGQHRIEAMRRVNEEYKTDIEDDPENDELRDDYAKFCEWEYPVNIMLLDKENPINKYVEIRAFVDINKKGRKVSTDLADNNMNNIRHELHELPSKQAYQQISTNAIKFLNDDIMSAWYKCIRKGDNLIEDRLIGIASFNLSIVPIVRKHVIRKYGKISLYSNDIIKEASEEVYKIIQKYWKAIGDKWDRAFYWDDENGAYRVDTDYNIQKSLGVFPLHKILNFYFAKGKLIENALEDAIAAINNSDVEGNEWIIGGRFSSFTSGAGHTKIKNIILGLKE